MEGMDCETDIGGIRAHFDRERSFPDEVYRAVAGAVVGWHFCTTTRPCAVATAVTSLQVLIG
jgi:hypothetical protein